MGILKNNEGISSGLSNLKGALDEITGAINLCSNLIYPINGKEIEAKVGELVVELQTVCMQTSQSGSKTQNAAIELENTEGQVQAYVDSEGRICLKSGLQVYDEFGGTIDFGKVEEMAKNSGMHKEELEEKLISLGLSRDEAKKLAESYGKDHWYEDLRKAGVDLWNSGGEVVSNYFGIFTGESTIEDYMKSKAEFFNKVSSTEAVLLASAVKGAGNIVEGVVDGVITVGGAGVAKITEQFSEEKANSIKEWVMDATSCKVVDSLYNKFYQDTELGRMINNNSTIKYDSELAQGVTTVSEFVGMVALASTGIGAGATAAVAGLKAAGEKAEVEYSDKENRDFYSGATKAGITGVWEAFQWYVGSKIGGTLNATDASQVTGKFWNMLYEKTSELSKIGKSAISASSEFVVGAADPFVRAGVDSVGSERSYLDILNEDYGGFWGAIGNGALAAGTDIAFDLGLEKVNRINSNTTTNEGSLTRNNLVDFRSDMKNMDSINSYHNEYSNNNLQKVTENSIWNQLSKQYEDPGFVQKEFDRIISNPNSPEYVFYNSIAQKQLDENFELLTEQIDRLCKQYPELNREKCFEVISAEVGKRPDPSDYLPERLIDDWKKDFPGKAWVIQKKSDFERFSVGKNVLGAPDGQYIFGQSTKIKIDEVLSNNISIEQKQLEISKILGFEGNYFEDGFVMIEREVDNYNFRMSTGNEVTANPLYSPGLQTSGGNWEGLLDPVDVIAIRDKNTGLFDLVSQNDNSCSIIYQ